MKSCFILLMFLVLVSCDKSYVLKINKDEVGFGGSINPTVKSYNFKAPDDFTAYTRSAEHFFRDQSVDSLMDYVTGRKTSFDVLDKDGQNLKVKLSLKTTDSLDMLYKSLLHGAAKKMKKPLVH